jgi:hypothetical protein
MTEVASILQLLPDVLHFRVSDKDDDCSDLVM